MTAPTESLLRSMLQDAAGDDEILSTTDYDNVIEVEATNIYRAAAMAARMIAATFAQKVNVAAGSVKISLEEKYQHYVSLADKLDFRAREGGGGSGEEYNPQLTGVSQAAMDVVRDDDDRPPSNFEMSMHDNPPFSYSGNTRTSDNESEEE